MSFDDESDIYDELEDYDKYGSYNPTQDPMWSDRYDPAPRSVIILYHNLHLLVTKLKIEIEFNDRDLPKDILEKMISTKLKNEKRELILLKIHDKSRLIVEYNIFINTELRNRLTKLGIDYDESDNYVNVVNYAKAKGLNLTDVFIIKSEILPWLGTTDLIYKDFDGNNRDFIWHEKKDRTAQIIATNKRLNGGAKLKMKKSRHNKYIRKINKISKKNYNRFVTNFHHGGADAFDTDNTADLFKNILTHLSNRHTNPLIRNLIPTCIIHPHEYSYTKEHFTYKLSSMGPRTEWVNVLYFLPNKDHVHNTPQNILIDHETNMLYTIRLDYRLGHMAVMSMLKVLMLDFDIKDYDVSSKEELRQNALQLFRNLNNYLISISNTPLVWYMSETGKGFHFFLIQNFY